MANALILASQSATRKSMLTHANISFEAVTSRVDEDKIKNRLLAQRINVLDIAQHLANAKAADVSQLYPGRWVVGADQTLCIDGDLLSKAHTVEEASQHLSRLCGKTHVLPTAVTVMKDGVSQWTHIEFPTLTMRPFSDSFKQSYLAQIAKDPGILGSVGCYRLEKEGIQLFSAVEGSYHTIMGLPLLPLLDTLRRLSLILT